MKIIIIFQNCRRTRISSCGSLTCGFCLPQPLKDMREHATIYRNFILLVDIMFTLVYFETFKCVKLKKKKDIDLRLTNTFVDL